MTIAIIVTVVMTTTPPAAGQTAEPRHQLEEPQGRRAGTAASHQSRGLKRERRLSTRRNIQDVLTRTMTLNKGSGERRARTTTSSEEPEAEAGTRLQQT